MLAGRWQESNTHQRVKVIRGVGKYVGAETQQLQILQDNLLKLGGFLGRIGVVKAHDKFAIVLLRKVLVQQCRLKQRSVKSEQ